MSTHPLHLAPELARAVQRAREALDSSGQLNTQPGSYKSPLGAKERAAVARMLRDGTYRRLVDAVVSDDPELADLLGLKESSGPQKVLSIEDFFGQQRSVSDSSGQDKRAGQRAY